MSKLVTFLGRLIGAILKYPIETTGISFESLETAELLRLK
jgi:hypothetical protein